MRLRLIDSDLSFLVETVATQRTDYDHIIQLVRDKESLLQTLSEKFVLARGALNSLSDHFLKYHRGRYFDLPAEA